MIGSELPKLKTAFYESHFPHCKICMVGCIFLLGSTNLAEGTARLNDKNIAEIYHNEKWIPICAHWFWNDNNGATLFCQQLGYEIGIIKQDSMERQVPLSADGFRQNLPGKLSQ